MPAFLLSNLVPFGTIKYSVLHFCVPILAAFWRLSAHAPKKRVDKDIAHEPPNGTLEELLFLFNKDVGAHYRKSIQEEEEVNK